MSYANGTPFLNLPQTVGSDHRDWFDTNEAFLNLDVKIKTLWDGASSTADILDQLQETVSGIGTDLAALTLTVNGHTTTLQTVNESLLLINSALTSLNTNVGTKFDSAGVADPYDPTYGIYDIDDIVTYNGQRYKCVTAVTAAEPFDADKWLAEDVQTVINQINDNLVKERMVFNNIISATFSQFLDTLHPIIAALPLADLSKLVLVRRVANNNILFRPTQISSTSMILEALDAIDVANGSTGQECIKLVSSGSVYFVRNIGFSGSDLTGNFTDYSALSPSSDTWYLYY